MKISVEDDGCEFDLSRLFLEGEESACFGLLSIKERIEYLGGSMDIDSRPGQGTRVGLIVPLENYINKRKG